MSIDPRHIGFAFPSFEVCVDPERVHHFNLAIGAYTLDEVPLTFLKVLEGERQSSRRIVEALGIDLRRLLHVEQHFEYLQPLRLGEILTICRTVKDIQGNDGRAMTFVTIESLVTRADDELVSVSRQILMVRDPSAPQVAA